MWLNFSDLIHHSVPDRKGNALPADITSGTYDLEDLDPGLGGNLIEGKVVLDKTWGHLTYGCLTCCGYTPYLSPNPVNVTVNGVDGISTFGTNNCTAKSGTSLSSYYYSTGVWSSDNAGIAKVTAFQAQGVAPGATIGHATATIPSGEGARPKPPCPQQKQPAQAPVAATAVPINFTSTPKDDGGGTLEVDWVWQSSSGKLPDLAGCTIWEYLEYSGVGSYSFASPPYKVNSFQTPWDGQHNDATVGNLQDFHKIPGGGFVTPYKFNSAVVYQVWQYSCPNYQSGAIQNGSATVNIVRTVDQNTNGSWWYGVSVAGGTSYMNPLP